MGLTATRPLHMKFPSAQELENIGRRRRITVEDRKRQEGARTRYDHFPAPRPLFPPRRHRHRSNDWHTEGASIRFGSNIHPSQTTPIPSQLHKPASVICHSESSHSMLLDKEISTCHQYNNIGSCPKAIITESAHPATKPRRTNMERSLVSLEQVRDSDNFDDVRARADSVLKQASVTQEQQISKRPKRRAANRSLPSDEAKSSSIVVGRRLLQSPLSRSEGSDLHRGSTGPRRGPVSGENFRRSVPDSLSSDFLPPSPGRDYNEERGPRNPSNGRDKIPIKSSVGPAKSQLNDLAPETGPSQVHGRSPFTLELQVEAEAQAAGIADILQVESAHPDAMLSNGQRNQSLSNNYSKFADDDTYEATEAGGVVFDEQDSKLAGSPPILTAIKHRGKSAQKSTSEHSGMSQSLVSLGGTHGLGLVQRGDAVSSGDLLAKKASQNHVQLRQANPMRQRLGILELPAIREQDQRHNIATQSDENQAWMRFILQDDLDAISNDFYRGPNTQARNVRGTPHGWLKHCLGDDGTLSEDRELRPSQSHDRSTSTPMHTIRTNANTAIHEADPHAGSLARGRIAPSETDFLSQLSPMEGQLDERLFNPSVYTNPAHTERSYVAAPSQSQGGHGNGVLAEYRGLLRTDEHDSSPVNSTHDDFEIQVIAINGSSTPGSRSVTTAKRHSRDRRPLQPIANLFADPRRPSFKQRPSSPRPIDEAFQSPPTFLRAPEQGSSGGQWIEPPPSTRRQINTFPMNYTPVRQTNKKRTHESLAIHRPSSSWSNIRQPSQARSEIIDQTPRHISHHNIFHHSPSTSRISLPHLETNDIADVITNIYSTPHSTKQRHHPQHHIPHSSPIPVIHPSSYLSSHTQPLQASPPSTDRLIFARPPPLLNPKPPTRPRERTSAVTALRQPVTPHAGHSLSTQPGRQRPMRVPLTPQRQASPFSTPHRPAFGSVLGGFRRPDILGGFGRAG